MKRILSILFFLAASAACASAQYTLVSGTIVDPNGVPYGGAVIAAQLSSPGATLTISNPATCTSSGFGSAPCQIPIPGTVGPVTTSAAGAFSLSVPSNTSILPASTQWIFQVTISPGVEAPWGTGSQAFSATITITGATQNISTTLNALAPKLTQAFPVATPLLLQTNSVNNGSQAKLNNLNSGPYITLTDDGVGDVVFALPHVQGTGANLLTADLFTGIGVPVCSNANGAATTSGCPTPAVGTEQFLSVNITPVTAGAVTTANQPLMSAASPIAAGALNSLKKTARFHAAGLLVNIATATNIFLQFSINGSVLTASATNPSLGPGTYSWTMDITVTTSATGASGTLIVSGTFLFGTGTTSGVFPYTGTASGVDLTAAMTPTNTVAFNTANATNIINQTVLQVEQLN
jgi:hypothetical protein